MTPGNEEYVAASVISEWLSDGDSIEQVALKWNQGSGSHCRRGVNSSGVKYDSCHYVQKVVEHFSRS